MEISTKYNIGDTVWVLSKVYDRLACPACIDGKLKGRDGKSYHCYNCDGTGEEVADKPTFTPKPSRIGCVKIEAYENGVYIRYSGGGILSPQFDEGVCYPTEAEAQEAADKMNAA